MQTTYNEDGVMNNYATEPAMLPASFPSPEQQQRYMLQGALTVLLLLSTVLIAFAAS